MVGVLKQILILSSCSFILHLLWELIQCTPFFIHLAAAPSIQEMIQATVGDVALTLAAFGLTWLVTQNRNWIIARWRLSTWAGIIGSAMLLSITIEIFALETGRWNYTDLNPIIPYLEISLLPVAQLALLFPATFGLTGKILRLRQSQCR